MGQVTQLIATDCRRAVIGTGVTGRSALRHLHKSGLGAVAFDTREAPPDIQGFREEFPDVELVLGPLGAESLSGFDQVVLSPGIDPSAVGVEALEAAGVEVVGDVQLFACAASAPIAAITGSNAKSTVTSLLGAMAQTAGIRVAVGGNLGTPALDLLDDQVELYVLELSSFQLELTTELGATSATILNLSSDHMDRYASMIEYHSAKQRIYRGAQHIVYNRDDPLTQPLQQVGQEVLSFGSEVPDLNQYGLIGTDLMRGERHLISASEVGLRGRHNLNNILAGFALGETLGIPIQPMIEAARSFPGLEHRCQTVLQRNGVTWVNDSKATNVAATAAAIEGLGQGKNLILIAGGVAKGQTFTGLQPLVDTYVKQLIVIGEAADQIALEAGCGVHWVCAVSMQAAVQAAAQSAATGDLVLLSPACASFDMFANFEDRGEQFSREAGCLI